MQFKIWFRPAYDRWFAYAVVSISLTVVLGVCFPISILYLKTLHKHPRSRRWGLLLALGWGLGLMGWAVLTTPALTFITWYMVVIPLAPLVALLLAWLFPLIRRTYTFDLDEKLAFQVEDQLKHRQRQQARASHRPEAEALDGHIPLAPIIELPEPFPAHIGVRVSNGWLYLSETALSQHLFVLGAPGSGKTELLKHLAYHILKDTRHDLFFIDGKGDTEIADFIASATRQTRGFSPPIFRLGQREPGSRYNAFVGEKEDIYNRLVSMLDTGHVQGGAAYYANVNKTLLQLLCYAPQGAPQDFDDLERRLHEQWLCQAYSTDRREFENLKAVRKHLDDLAVWLQPLIRDFRQRVCRDGFTFDDARVGVFSIRTQSVGETSRQFLNVMNADLMDFMGKRQQRPTVVIVDEFQAFKNASLAETLSLGRSSQLVVVLATQDTASIGDRELVRRILANTKNKILMGTDFPEDVGQIAGTEELLEHSYQHEEGQVTGLGTSRLQHQHRIPLNEVARLRPGEAYYIRQRYSCRVQFRRVQLAT